MERKRETVAKPIAISRAEPTQHSVRLRLAILAALVTVLAMAVALLVTGCSTEQGQDVPADGGETSGQAAGDNAAMADAGAEGEAQAVDDAAGEVASDDAANDEAAAGDDAGDDASEDGDAAGEAADAGDEDAADQEGLVELDITPPPVIDNVAFVEGDEVIELPESTSVLLGEPAPDFTMTLLETGEEVSLSDYDGQPVIVNFWATWCPPCLLEMPFFEGVYQDHQDEGLVVIAVDAGERVPPSMIEDTVRRFVDSKGLTFPVVMGENAYEVQKAYAVGGLPATFLVDRDGVVVDAHQGAYPNQATLEEQVKAILGGEAEG